MCSLHSHSSLEVRNVYCSFYSTLLGRECLRRLVKHGVKCSYVLISAVSYVIKEVCELMFIFYNNNIIIKFLFLVAFNNLKQE